MDDGSLDSNFGKLHARNVAAPYPLRSQASSQPAATVVKLGIGQLGRVRNGRQTVGDSGRNRFKQIGKVELLGHHAAPAASDRAHGKWPAISVIGRICCLTIKLLQLGTRYPLDSSYHAYFAQSEQEFSTRRSGRLALAMANRACPAKVVEQIIRRDRPAPHSSGPPLGPPLRCSSLGGADDPPSAGHHSRAYRRTRHL